MLKGVKFFNQKGIMHRDIKLDNLMYKKKGDLSSLKIIDFGIG